MRGRPQPAQGALRGAGAANQVTQLRERITCSCDAGSERSALIVGGGLNPCA
jgi:hypothetical protein